MTDAAPPTGGDSALLVPIPQADAIVGGLRLRHDPVASDGIPAHVTVLFPFVPRARLSVPVRQALTELFGSLPAFEYRFGRVGRFADSTVYLAPEPPEPFSGLTQAAHRHWREHPPYGGVFEVVIPHLSVGDQLAPGAADRLAAEAAEALARHGPVVGRATEVWLMTEDDAGRWSTDSTFPLAISPDAG